MTTSDAPPPASRSEEASARESPRSATSPACSPPSAASKTSRRCNSFGRSPNSSAASSAGSSADQPPNLIADLPVQELPTWIAGETQMHQDANTGHSLCTLVSVSRRRKRRTSAKGKRQAPSASEPFRSAATGVRHATDGERLAYTRTQAAEALGVSRSTFDRRVLPLLETIDMPWGTRLVPVDALERFVDERRRPARGRAPTAHGGAQWWPSTVRAVLRREGV